MTERTEADRRDIVANVVAGARLDGFELEPGYIALYDGYITGELTLDDVMALIDAWLAQHPVTK